MRSAVRRDSQSLGRGNLDEREPASNWHFTRWYAIRPLFVCAELFAFVE
jgi:hypothetical protein